MLRLSIEYDATIFDSKKVINKNSVIANVTSPICFLGVHRGNVYIKKVNMNHYLQGLS